MFLNFFNLIKLPYKSPASRHINYFKNIFCLQNVFKPLFFKKKNNAGRNDSKKIILWTKKKLCFKKKTIKINYNIRYKKLGFIASFHFIFFKNKLLTLLFFSNGAVTYYITTNKHILFSYYFLNFKKSLRNFFKENYWSFIFQLKKLIFICFIELTPGKQAQYVLSSGVKSKLFSIDVKTKSALIILPSKVKKTISYYSCVFLGQIALEENKKYINIKSGYWRKFGLKSIVRGVAMNPIDHPHGGRTKAIRYQRTPWGKTTKFK